MLTSTDSCVLDAVDNDVFDNPVDPRWTAEFLADPRHHMAVAIIDGVVVGMASGVHYVHPDKAPELWINEVGVAESYRRQGIARRLMDVLFEHARMLGCLEAWVATELDNEAARALYRATQGQEEEIVYYTFKLTP